MTTATRLASYGAALALVFGATWGLGAATGSPASAPVPPAHSDMSGDSAGVPSAPDGGDAPGHDASGMPDAEHGGGAPQSDGRSSAAAGYRMALDPTARPGELAFTVTGPDTLPVAGYAVEHGRALHLIVVRSDGTGYQHLHPLLGGDGVWRAPVAMTAPGLYRAMADFTPDGGPRLVLGADLFLPGAVIPATPAPSRVWQADGYQVRLDGDLVPGGPSQVFATVSKDGAAVTDLEPYLGAFGHLVALRSSDLAYLHVHPSAAGAGGVADAAEPVATDRSGPGIAFVAEAPTAGTYRLYLDFSHGGTVRTAEFTIPTRGTS